MKENETPTAPEAEPIQQEPEAPAGPITMMSISEDVIAILESLGLISVPNPDEVVTLEGEPGHTPTVGPRREVLTKTLAANIGGVFQMGHSAATMQFNAFLGTAPYQERAKFIQRCQEMHGKKRGLVVAP